MRKRKRLSRATGAARRTRVMPDMTPVVNVALVILIVFMVIMPMVREGIKVDIPAADSSEQLADNAEQLVVLSIRQDGSLYVNLTRVDWPQLKQELALAYRGQEGSPIIIKGARNLLYEDVLRVMETCQGVGAPAVDLMAKKNK